MTASHPDVSVVIAAFDAESTIAEAVDSALAQRGVSLEVVVVDDSSRDRTAAIAAGFSDDRVKVLVLPENRGPGARATPASRWREAAGLPCSTPTTRFFRAASPP